MKVDLTKTVVATFVRRVQDGSEMQVQKETSLSQIATQHLRRVRTFKEAEAVRDLLQKVKLDAEFLTTESEFNILFNIYRSAETETKLVFADMVHELNEDFSIVQYEESLPA